MSFFHDYSIWVSVAGTILGSGGALLSFFNVKRRNRAEKHLISLLMNSKELEISENSKEKFTFYVNDEDYFLDENIARQHEILSGFLGQLEKDERKQIKVALEQPSKKGRAHYVARVFRELHAKRPNPA